MFNNKRAELITIFILLIGLAILVVAYGEHISTKDYIGDSMNKVAYNIRSPNLNCDLHSIKIDNQNIRFFQDKQEVVNFNYSISPLCP